MKRLRAILLLAAVLFSVGKIRAEIELSGFVNSFYQDGQSDNSSFGVGAFEIDFASEFSDRISFEGAVVVEDGVAGVGQTLVDIKLLPEEKLGVQTGLIDIPFGIDYRVFATPDRKLVSPPLVTELMMDGGWGDTGINLYGSLLPLNYNIYVVNGMGEIAGVPVNQDADNNNAKTVGSRIGISPKEDVEVGFSYAQGAYLDDNTEEIFSRTGCDVQVSLGRIKVKGEYIAGEEEIPGASANEHRGYYFQFVAEATEKGYSAVRYGFWKPKGGERVTRLTLGLGHELEENVSLRFEYQMNDEKPKEDINLVSAQIVISF
ncbi:MAG: porin [Candidatus Pacebacteria bacterium]|nr:porin [Candidatus Paceibacterota bacterium]